MFPDIKNKKFVDISTNESFHVKSQFENIAILDNNQRVDVQKLLDRNYYEELIDPENFFGSSSYKIFADKIKAVPLESIKEDYSTKEESLILQYDEEEEKRLLEQKAKNMYKSAPNASGQVNMLRDIIGDDEELQDIDLTQIINVPNPVQKEIRSEEVVSNKFYIEEPKKQKVEDPMTVMFKNIKRNTDFSITIDILNKIPRPDFIEMMEDSYEVSIIDYLANEFTKNILSDTSIIENKIKDSIREIVYGKSKKLEESKPESKTKTRQTRSKKVLDKND